MLIYSIAALLLGFVILSASAKYALKKVMSISKHFGISEFIISFLFVGVVTILPEFSIGVVSALEGAPSFGLGIILGSNIADLTLVLGLVALLSNGLDLNRKVAEQSSIFLISVFLPLLLLLDGEISRVEGVILVLGFILYVIFILMDKRSHVKTRPQMHGNIALEFLLLLLSVGVLFLSGELITRAAIEISTEIFVPLFFLGAMIAVGTCLPELTFAIAAARNKRSELGFGDVLGNVFADAMASIGVIAIISPIKPSYPQLAILGAAFMALAMLIVIFIIRKKHSISKVDGAALILLYIVFIIAQLLFEKLITP
ncbi:MAG TPA: hypothetical protein VJG83_04770 [archaeon]|nr:hypothetical protein [archaeon]